MVTDTKELWDLALDEIKKEVSNATFITWFKSTYVQKYEDGTVYVAVPNKLAKDWFVGKYHNLILRALRGITEGIRSVEYVVSEGRPKDKSRNVPMPMPSANELPLNDLYVNREDNLNPRYVFDTFVVGSFNELAYAASQAVIKNLGCVYNPLFIYGRTGHGKTHMIQAIGNTVKKNYNGKRVYYVTSERFAQDLVNSLQSKQVKVFKEKYRKYDVFIMDDIQFLSNKEKTQEELFHLFNSLYDNNKQIIFSSDQHPNYIPGLEDRLRSRFAAGMIVDIPAPDHESRVAILKSKAQQSNFAVPKDALDYLAKTIEGNVRQLEGALNAIVCQSQLKGRELSVNEIQHLVKDSMRPKRSVSMDEIIKIVSSFYNIEEENIYKKTRKKEVVRPRQIIMYLLREDYGYAFPAIGQKLGGRDHTTVIHSHERIKTQLNNDISLSRDLEQIRASIG